MTTSQHPNARMRLETKIGFILLGGGVLDIAVGFLIYLWSRNNPPSREFLERFVSLIRQGIAQPFQSVAAVASIGFGLVGFFFLIAGVAVGLRLFPVTKQVSSVTPPTRQKGQPASAGA